jgi:hypothetical protein
LKEAIPPPPPFVGTCLKSGDEDLAEVELWLPFERLLFDESAAATGLVWFTSIVGQGP